MINLYINPNSKTQVIVKDGQIVNVPKSGLPCAFFAEDLNEISPSNVGIKVNGEEFHEIPLRTKFNLSHSLQCSSEAYRGISPIEYRTELGSYGLSENSPHWLYSEPVYMDAGECRHENVIIPLGAVYLVYHAPNGGTEWEFKEVKS